MDNGSVKAWGYNNFGQLGSGNSTTLSTPTVISGLTGVKQVIAGYDHSLALMNDGTVMAWGNNAKGQLGLGDTVVRNTPTVISDLVGVVQIVAGLNDSFALLEDGTVKAWGANDYGKLGTGDTSYTYKNTPISVTNLTGVKQLAAGYDHVLALLEDGTVKAWGNNGQSRLGLGDTSNRSTPTVITNLSGVSQVAAGRLHSLAYLDNGNVLSWGANPYGQLGVGDTTGRTTPTIIYGLSYIDQIITGPSSQHSLAILKDGTIKTWGYNYYGQLGLGDTTNRNLPTGISGVKLNFLPKIEIIKPSTNAILTEEDTNYELSIKVSDANNDNLDCKYFIGNETTPREVLNVSNTSNGQTVTFSAINLGELPEGNNIIRFEVGDNIGNPVTLNLDIQLDKSGPLINMGSIIPTTSAITINGAATDAISGLDIQPYRYKIGTEESNWVNDTAYTSQNQLIPNTQYPVSFEAKDAKGHISSYTQGIYTEAETSLIDISSISPSSISISVSDNNPSTTQYQISVNNGEKYVSENGGLVETAQWITIPSKSKTITGLSFTTTYSFQIKAKNGDNIETSLSSAISGTTLEEDPNTIVPSAPTNLVCLSKTSTSAALSWEAPADNRGLEGYKIFSNGIEIGSTAETSFLCENLTSNTTYSFIVRAYNPAGILSDTSDEISVTTDLPPDSECPTEPGNITSSAVSFTTINLSWEDSTDNVGVVGYKIFRDTVEIGTTNGNSYTDTYLTQGTTYSYTVKAVDAAGNLSGPSNELRITTEASTDNVPPIPPSNLLLSEKTKTRIDLIWDAATDNIGVAGYRIYRNSKLIGNSFSASYTDTGLSQGTTYTYVIKAYDEVGNVSNSSNEITVSTDIGVDTEAPSAPTNLRVESKTSTSIKLIWDASTDNVAVASYKVYRNGIEIRSVGGTSFMDSDLAEETDYTYTIKACDSAGNISITSAAITVNTSKAPDLIAPSTPLNLKLISKTKNSVTLSWDTSLDNIGVTEYIVFNGSAPIGATSGETTFNATGLLINTLYKFIVKAKDAAGNTSSASNEINITLIVNEIDRTTGGAISASSENAASGEGKEKAFDDSTTTKWVTNSSTGWIQYQFSSGNKYAISKYTFTSADDNPDFDPKDWTLKGSNDGVNWITLDSRTGEDFTSLLQKKSYSFTNTTAYEYYRFELSNHNGSALQISEIELVDQILDESTTLLKKDYIIQNPSGKIYYMMQVPNNIDDLQNVKFSITYNVNDLDVIDLCATTSQIDMDIGNISGTGITIERFEPGIIVLSANGFVINNKRVVSSIHFKTKNNYDTKLTLLIQK